MDNLDLIVEFLATIKDCPAALKTLDTNIKTKKAKLK
jgi:hypothetical protein